MANALLASGLLVVVVVAWCTDKRSWEDKTTLGGFLVVELIVLAVGFVEDRRVKTRAAKL